MFVLQKKSGVIMDIVKHVIFYQLYAFVIAVLLFFIDDNKNNCIWLFLKIEKADEVKYEK